MSRVTELVDPFIGVDGGGNCLCGPYQPLGLVRLGPETTGIRWETTGYRSGQPIRYFTHTHVHGTGGPGRLGNIGVMPFTGEVRFDISPAPGSDETAAVAYYSVLLQSEEIRVELTATRRVGVHRITFPAGAQANLLFDLGAVVRIGSASDGEESARCIGGFIEATSATELIGRGDYKGGWGHNFPYSVYMYARLDTAAEWHLATATGQTSAVAVDGACCQGVAALGSVSEVNLQVGVSFVSIAKARASVEREVSGLDFDAVRAVSVDEWEDVLGCIRVSGGQTEKQTLFYTMLYRFFCMPTDLGVDDENPFWESGVRQFSEIACLWDSVRNANSLLTLIAPERERDLLNALIDIADHTGWMPDAWIGGHSAYIQGGSSADVLFCEAKLKGLTGIDYDKALAHMLHNAETPSPNPRLHGRYLEHYRDAGFVPDDVKNCVSRHLEYAYHDWCIGKLAEQLGKTDVAERFYRGSQRVWNLWRDDISHFAPRSAAGAWVEPFDPQTCRADCWNDPYFYEGSSSQWSYCVHHDFAGLIRRCGGPEAFVARLDGFFAGREGGFSNGGYHSKETMLHVPYLYINAGRPDKTQACVRECMERNFRATRDGLSDNEDMGCQSTFYMASAIGLYPLMGQDLYWLTTPLFEHIEIGLGGSGKTLQITAPGAGSEAIYIAGATLNGCPLHRAWLRHGEIADGGHLEFVLSAQPTEWGRGEVE